MKKSTIWVVIFFQLLLNVRTANAEIKSSECLLPASTFQSLSLGKPLATERLGNKSSVRIGVLPFYFSDGIVKKLSDWDKKDYENAANDVEKLSNQKVSIEIVFLPTVKATETAAEFREMYKNQQTAWKDMNLEKSTWGFVKRTILLADKDADFSKIDSVILEGGNIDKSVIIGEALTFFRGSQGNVVQSSASNFFRSVSTQEGFIDNAILLDSHKGVSIIAHEILHNFGLTDLYGGESGPKLLSIMDTDLSSMLNYEKAVLGWFPIEDFKCSELPNVLDNSKVENVLTIEDRKKDSIYLLKVSNDKAYIIEVINKGTKSSLVIYLLEQNKRPPITVFYSPKVKFDGLLNLADTSSIGSFYTTPDFDLLVSNITGNSVQLNLIPSGLTKSSMATQLIQKSLNNKAAAASTQASKKVSIYCIKGNTTKKVIAVAPVCPKGYVKKK
jgi:M6 family metalloprotease-like protein